MLRKLFFIVAIILLSEYSFSQTVTGSWYGKADVLIQGNNSNYLTELIIKQKGNEVEGIFGYYFKDSYQSFFIRGTYDKKTRQVNIKNLPLLFYGASTRNGIECPMQFMGTLMVSQVGSSLRGSFYTDNKYKYTCPELKVSYLMDASERNQDSVLRNTVAGKKIWEPQEEDFIVTDPSGRESRTVTADVSAASNTDNIPIRMDEVNEMQLIEKFEKRKNIYSKDIEIESDSIRVSFYDNGDIDGDSISVFLNGKPVLANQLISSRALNIYLSLDSTQDLHELSMLAENLGIFPPNTALMVISDGVNRHEIYLSSSLTQNAAIRLKRKR